ncbi:MAG TPA: P1 family peptidase [Gemmatimonadales bacterium]|nr:P1 family peptidase [Gemmatimonadales bacterium]
MTHRPVVRLLLALGGIVPALAAQAPRARDLGLTPGVLPPGPRNAITDVAGVRVGQVTITGGDSLNTGITAILPHGGNLFLERVPAAIHVGNGFGKFVGVSQLAELGELETPILLTCTLCVWRAADAMVAWMLAQPGMANVRSINPVVGETNDGALNAIRARPIRPEDVAAALERADTGAVAEGSVGAGRGTVAFGFKGGIGTASRRLPASLGGWTVGVLVQANYGGILQMDGLAVGERAGRHSYRRQLLEERGDGSIIVIVATDAPLTERQLERLAARAMGGIARTGSDLSHGSGDYAVAFSTHPELRRPRTAPVRTSPALVDDAIAPVFLGAIEATEEAIYNALVAATPVSAKGRTVEPVPVALIRAMAAERARSAP